MGESQFCYSQSGNTNTADSIKARVLHLLDKNPLLTAKPLCKLLNLDFKKYKDYVDHIRSAWKTDSKNEQVPKRPIFRNWRGFVYVPEGLSRDHALTAGWTLSRSRNRPLLWKDQLGRLEWFETGRVNIWLRQPASEGRLAQLLAMAFYRTGLIPDIEAFEVFRKSARSKGAQLFFENSKKPEKRLIHITDPKAPGPNFAFRLNPTHNLAMVPDWPEKNERLFVEFMEGMRRLFGSPEKQLGKSRPDFQDYAR